ncbi:MAG: antitoxin [Gammaproteobacteria bacterium]|nr:MAG: antitoxin [Gammaproteobacteria bacterium]
MRRWLVERVSVFKSNKSQAVRLPKRVAYPEEVTHVDIVADGRARIITPAGESWDTWFESEPVSEDFMTERHQPAPEEREAL